MSMERGHIDMEGGSAPKGYYDEKERGNLNQIELWVIDYNRLPESTQNSACAASFFGLIFLNIVAYGLCSEVGTFIVALAWNISVFFMLFAFWLLAWIYRYDEGPTEMRSVARAIKEGAEGYVAVQYGTIRNIALVFAVLLFLLYMSKPIGIGDVSNASVAVITSLTFLVGAVCSALSGYAVVNVALVVNGISTLLMLIRKMYPGLPFGQMPLLLVGYGFGASLVAMFAQLGGGIYTKAADVGADLVGKIEQEIPEDDPRNPAVIADLVGDNVGDCAGQCADTFESIAAEIMATMILGGALAEKAKFTHASTACFVLFPLVVHCLDLVVSSIGIMLVRTEPGMPTDPTKMEDPMAIMKRAYMVTVVLGIAGFAFLCSVFLDVEGHDGAWKCFAGCGAIGIITAYSFVLITQYYTDYEYSQVQGIAEASLTGPGTNIIAGIAVGMESTACPVVLIVTALIAAYNLGKNSGIAVGEDAQLAGLFGTAVATMGMLSTAVFVLTMSSFGPIADNAGGIVEMAEQPERVRAITDRLDAVGNVTKANTKGFSVGSAALACFLLFRAFLDEVEAYTKEKFNVVDLAIPEVFCGGLLGAMVVFLFSSMAFRSVGNCAHDVVKEVRSQFREKPGIMAGTDRPDYQRCVAIVSKAALVQMVKPGLLSICAPIVVGFIFRHLGVLTNQPMLGVQAVAAFLMFSTSTGILMALFLNNAGGAWDNAKKYVELGNHGGKNTEAHKAAIVGDTVGDPAKDTAGPSVHVLIKLVSTVTMVLAPLFIGPQTFHPGQMSSELRPPE